MKENTAIAMAIEQNHVELVRLLLQNGAQATAKLAATIRTNTKKTINKKVYSILLPSPLSPPPPPPPVLWILIAMLYPISFSFRRWRWQIDKMLEDAAADELKKSNDEKVSGILANPLGLAVLKGDTQKVKHYLMNDKSMRALVQETDSEGNSMYVGSTDRSIDRSSVLDDV